MDELIKKLRMYADTYKKNQPDGKLKVPWNCSKILQMLCRKQGRLFKN